MTASCRGWGGGELRGGEIEQKGKMTHGHEPQCGDCWELGRMTELNGDGKNI